MLIKIKDGKRGLPRHVKELGVKAGDRYEAHPCPESNFKAVRFNLSGEEGERLVCTVMEENYTIV